MHEREFGFATRALHAGTPPDPATGARVPPIYQTAAFVFDSTEQAAELFALRSYGHIYSRISNPTVAAFEERMASLEGGLGAVAFSSGLAAQLCGVLALAQAGDHLVSSANVYGGTVTQFSVTLKRMGIEVTFVPSADVSAIRKAVRPNTKLLFAETIGNPAGTVCDIGKLAQIAHGCGIPLVIDNTFASPYLCRPIEHGADIVLHSATKFIAGHGTVIGGVLVESGKFDWGTGRFPLLSEPSPGYHQLSFTETFGEYAFLMRTRVEVLRDVGASLAPMDAWLLLQGLETLPVRMAQHVVNAKIVAAFLRGRPEVLWVSYPDLPQSAHYELVRRYLPLGAGSIFSFGIRGGREAGRKFIDTLELWSHLANVGDVKSLVIHPASTTHSQLNDADMIEAGVGPEMVRLSVGIEDVDDLTWDLDRALRASGAQTAHEHVMA
ncbi:MAG: O-acetylhomoserine aminocarboxypropyltransferase/cysteine synthase [Candidatus Eremiobacteraeota bacterium]|nr:O-acetylhomoserine aminocarboxypropyltransferase/cysteine synthase [Candidatus Eremiobacteraeota bacterium]